jgi:predicted lactoylglutathione lyase
MFTEDQISNLESHAKVMIEAKKNISANINHLIKEAQKAGYKVSPKTGKVTKI